MPVLPFYQVDAFASQAFEGNQACIMPLEAFMPDDVMLAIAAENNVLVHARCGGAPLRPCDTRRRTRPVLP